MRLYFTIFFFLISITGFASKNRESIDSLKNLVSISLKEETGPDTLIITRLSKLAAGYFDINPDSTIYYSQKAIMLSRKINYKPGLANGLLETGHAYFFKGNFKAAKKSFDEAITIFKQINDKRGLAESFMLYGKMYNLLANYNTAIDYLNQAININQQINYDPGLADSYKNMGIIYYSRGGLSTALDFYYKALLIDIKLHDNLAAAANYNNIGVVLQNMEMYPNALRYFKKALGILQGANNLHGVGVVNENIGEVLLTQNNYDQAINYLSKALKILKKQDDKEAVSSVYTDLGLCYANKNKIKPALNYLKASLQMAIKYKIVYNQAMALIGYATVYNLQKDYKNAYIYAIDGQKAAIKMGNISLRTKATLQLNNTLAGLKEYELAYKVLRQYNDLKDSLNNNESLQKLTSYNLELDFAAKEQQLKLKQHEKDDLYKQKIQQQTFVIAIFLLLILAMIGVSLVYYRQKLKQQKINLMLGERNKEVLEQKADLDEQARKLNELNTLKDRLISILAHDLRAPLSTLRGVFSLLQDDTISHQEMLDMIPVVLKKLEYTSGFLDTLLFWINSQMENFENSAKSFLIKDIVSVEKENYQEQAALKGIKLIDKVPDNLVASADPNSIRMVIRNLITNAIKFSKENDRIEISAGNYDRDTQIISVNDSGTGISEEQLGKLFKSKVNSKAGTQNETGTGMGLLFCKDLVEKCNGKIWATSKPGAGTTVSFTIPSGPASSSEFVTI